MERLFEKLCMPQSHGPSMTIDEAKKLNFNDLLVKVCVIAVIYARHHLRAWHKAGSIIDTNDYSPPYVVSEVV